MSSLGSGQTIGSRLNFTGIEDLGGGLKAAFVLETGFLTDTGMGTSNPPGAPAGSFSFGRASSLAIGTDRAGYLSFGRQYTPLWDLAAGGAADPFGASWLGGANLIFGNTVRASNSVAYSYGYGPITMMRSAPVNGLGFAAMYSLGEQSSPLPDSAGSQAGFNASYGARNAWAGFGYHQIRGNSPAINASLPASASPTLKQANIAAMYDFGFMRLNGQLHRSQNGLTGAGSLKRRGWSVGVIIPFENHAARLPYGQRDDRTPVDADLKTFQVGYSYNFSKRTFIYTAYGLADNSAAGSTPLLGALGTYRPGSTSKAVTLGLRHDF